MQPYFCGYKEEVKNNMKKFRDNGAYGVIIEGMKYRRAKPGLVKVGGDYTYPLRAIKYDMLELKEEAHKFGLKFFSGENRTREVGDSLTCCGVDDLEGFKPNHFNLNHLVNGDAVKPTSKMIEAGTGSCFGGVRQETAFSSMSREQSFLGMMLWYYENSKSQVEEVFGKNSKSF